jgi:hypothetical protein
MSSGSRARRLRADGAPSGRGIGAWHRACGERRVRPIDCTIAFAALVACGTAAEPEDGGARSDAGSMARTDGGADRDAGTTCVDGDPFAPAALRADVAYLASPELGGRAPGTPGDLAARAYIEERFECLGLSPGAGGSFQQTFVNGAGAETANVIAILPGASPDVIVVGAHHDHLGVEGADVYAGANDNASGIAGLLAIAKAFRQRPPPARTVAFVAFGSEETLAEAPYVEGSAHYVDHAPPELPIARTVYMLNLDMIGTYSSEDLVYALGSYESSAARSALDALVEAAPIEVDLGEPPEIGGSDFYPFCVAGVPFVFFWTDDPDCYHDPCDTADRLDYESMSEIARLAFALAGELADTSADLAAERRPGSCGTDG